MNEISEELKERIEKETEWNITEYENYYYISRYSNAGEDFGFEVNKGEDIAKQIDDYYEDFDPSEHASLWYGANRGEPSDIGELYEDAKDIEKHLKILADLVNGREIESEELTYEQAKYLFYSNYEIMNEEFDYHEIDNLFARMEITISDIANIKKERNL